MGAIMCPMRKTANGFTIIELLIVIVVIAILAAISVVAYTGIQDRARASAHAHAASQTEREIMTYALQANGESISLGGSLVGYIEGVGDIELLRPLTGAPDITMYAVYDVINTSVHYSHFARLEPYTTGNGFVLQSSSVGDSQMTYRIDTSAQSSLGYGISGVRIPGSTVIGWLQASNNATARAFSYNQAAATQSSSLSPHAGWNFTGLSLKAAADGTPRLGLVFNANHDLNTRAQVIGWLAQKYNVSL